MAVVVLVRVLAVPEPFVDLPVAVVVALAAELQAVGMDGRVRVVAVARPGVVRAANRSPPRPPFLTPDDYAGKLPL